MTISDCVSIWNSAANAAVRALTIPPIGPTGTFFAPGGGSTTLSGGQSYDVFVAIREAAGSVLASEPPPPGCIVFFHFPGDAKTPPSMLSIPTTADASSYDLASAELYYGSDNTDMTGLPQAIQAKDGTLSVSAQAGSSS